MSSRNSAAREISRRKQEEEAGSVSSSTSSTARTAQKSSSGSGDDSIVHQVETQSSTGFESTMTYASNSTRTRESTDCSVHLTSGRHVDERVRKAPDTTPHEEENGAHSSVTESCGHTADYGVSRHHSRVPVSDSDETSTIDTQPDSHDGAEETTTSVANDRLEEAKILKKESESKREIGDSSDDVVARTADSEDAPHNVPIAGDVTLDRIERIEEEFRELRMHRVRVDDVQQEIETRMSIPYPNVLSGNLDAQVQYSILTGNADVVELLLSAGRAASGVDACGGSAMAYAILSTKDVVTRLIAARAPIDIVNIMMFSKGPLSIWANIELVCTAMSQLSGSPLHCVCDTRSKSANVQVASMTPGLPISFSDCRMYSLVLNGSENADIVNSYLEEFRNKRGLVVVSICNHSFNGSRLTHLERGLQAQCEDLRCLDLSNCGLTDNNFIRLSSALAGKVNISSLVLDGNDLTAGGIVPIKQLLGNLPLLSHLSLRGNGLQTTGVLEIAEALLSVPNPHLRRLDISNNGICNGCADNDLARLWTAIARCKRLEWLSLSQNWISDAAIAVFATRIRELPNLFWLSLCSNELGPESGMALGQQLGHCKKMRWLAFGGNKLSNKGVRAIVEGVKELKDLRALGIDGNNVLDENLREDVNAMLSHVPLLLL